MRPRTSVGACLMLAAALLSCGEDSTSSGNDAALTSSIASTAPEAIDLRDEAVPESAPVTSEPSPRPTSTAAPATVTPTATLASDSAPCTDDAILPVVAGLFPGNDRWNIVAVDIVRCRGGYAQVIAIPDQSTCPADTPVCLENEQVFLEDVAGAWAYVDSGTGIDCRNPGGMRPDMIVVCDALGLSR